jgi:hypothetical protein
MTVLHFSFAPQTKPAMRGRMADVRVQAGVATNLNPRGPS